jgi:hypothetical protein
MTPRVLGYAGLLLLLVALALLLTASKEKQYESLVVRLKGKVIAKDLRPLRLGKIYGVRYRVTVQGQTLEREGDVQSQETWGSIRVGDDIEVESIGVTPNETRLAPERVVGSKIYFGIAAASALAGVVLLVMRLKGGSAWSAAKPQP